MSAKQLTESKKGPVSSSREKTPVQATGASVHF